MSHEAVARFIEAIDGTPELQKECRQVYEGSTDPSGFVAFARRSGFEVTAEEVLAYFGGLPAPGRRELGPEQLSQAVGGFREPVSRPAGHFQLVGCTPTWATSSPVEVTPIQLP